LSNIERFRKPNAEVRTQGLNQLLEQLGSQGRHHSEGQFTLSLEKALEKLKQFQLKDPNFYILNLISAAVLQGASTFRVELGSSGDTVKFDGDRFTREQLENIFVSEQPALKELAVGLTAAKALDYEYLLFQSEGGLDWSETTPEFHDAGSQWNVLTLVKRSLKKGYTKPDEWQDAWSARSGQALKASCQLAPLKIVLRSCHINKTTLYIMAPAFLVQNPEISLPRIKKLGRKETEITALSSNGRFTALVGCNSDGGVRDWHFVYRGITYTRTHEQLNMPGLGGVVVSDGFKKDISHNDIVEDDFFHEVVRELQDLLMTYVTRHLTLKPLEKSEAHRWLGATTMVAQRLQQAGNKREAARVDAWTYGHRAKMKLLGTEHCMDLFSRYDQRLVFLLDYFYWNSQKSIEKQLRILNGPSGRTIKDEDLLLPWVEGAQAQSMILLAQFLLPAFPSDIGWKTLTPFWSRLSGELSADAFREQILSPLLENVERVTSCSDVKEMISLCGAAAFLDSYGLVHFEAWLGNALESGKISAGQGLRVWFRQSAQKDVAERLFQQLDSDIQQKELSLANTAFGGFVEDAGSPLAGIGECLERALKFTDDKSERSDLLALLCLVDHRLSETPNPARKAWHLHRAGLVCGCREKFEMAGEFHERAHRELQDHWFSFLLMGDRALALRKNESAHHYYTQSLALMPSSTCAREAVIETADSESRLEQWLALARSVSVTKLESYYAYREALELPSVKLEFASWVKLRVATSYAEYLAGGVSSFDQSLLFHCSLHTPSSVRSHIRELRRYGHSSLAFGQLARLRLAQQLSLSVPLKLQWKDEYRD
jgi:tetratricopeptide (TPR) repeat protein